MPVVINRSLFAFSKIGAKSVTTALGGSVRFVKIDDEDAEFRMKIPFHLARQYIKAAKNGSFLAPQRSEVIMYDGQIVGFERFPYAAYKNDTQEELEQVVDKWISRSRRALDKLILPYIEESSDLLKWCIDGYAIYGIPLTKQDWINDSVPLNKAGTFRRLRVPVFNLSLIGEGSTAVNDVTDLIQESDCLVFKAPNDDVYITPPIWKHLGQVGSSKLTSGDSVDTELFDTIDEKLHVNVNFALDVAEKITTLFGYEAAEALQLPELMIEYHTVNLMALPVAVKQTAPCGIQFTHVLAWLFGLFRDQVDIKEMLNFRTILKHLTTKGLQMGDVTGEKAVYTDLWMEEEEEDRVIPMLTFDEIEKIRTGNNIINLASIGVQA